jgi:hypothetical protein
MRPRGPFRPWRSSQARSQSACLSSRAPSCAPRVKRLRLNLRRTQIGSQKGDRCQARSRLRSGRFTSRSRARPSPFRRISLPPHRMCGCRRLRSFRAQRPRFPRCAASSHSYSSRHLLAFRSQRSWLSRRVSATVTPTSTVLCMQVTNVGGRECSARSANPRRRRVRGSRHARANVFDPPRTRRGRRTLHHAPARNLRSLRLAVPLPCRRGVHPTPRPRSRESTRCRIRSCTLKLVRQAKGRTGQRPGKVLPDTVTAWRA